MKKGKCFTLPLILAPLLLLLAFPVLATHSGIHLVPDCGALDACTVCDLFVLVQNILNFLWKYITVPLAALFLAYGGVLWILPYLGGSAKMMERGKKVIQQALAGVLIVLVAWLAIDTIIKVVGQMGGDLPTGSGKTAAWGPWNQIFCFAPEIKVTTQPVSTGNGDNGSGNGTLPPGTLTHGEATKKIKAASMLICATQGGCENPCADRQNPKCTYLGGTPEALISELTRMQREMQEIFGCSDCVFKINGYSETGHDTHGAGKSIMDIDNNESSLDKTDEYFMSRANQPSQKPKNNTWYQDKSKLSKYYLYEGNHWHVCLNTTDCPEAVGDD